MKIILCGYNGRMGNAVRELAAAKNAEVVAGVDISIEANNGNLYHSITDVKEEADVIIDFSNHKAVGDILAYAIKTNTAVVLCTTGYTDDEHKQIACAANQIPVFYSRNMSLGVNAMCELCRNAAKLLGSDYDVEIIEKHHNQKLDAPSGTALMIAEEISDALPYDSEYIYDRTKKREKRKPSEIGIHSIRGGTIIGEHEVMFCGKGETITISHSAGGRELFAQGALNAAQFISDMPKGIYSMKELLKAKSDK